MAGKHLNTILIKPTSWGCNLRCDYCFYLEKEQYYPGALPDHRMSEETLEEMIKQSYERPDPPIFAWQGGEPTMMGLPFFRKALELQHHYAEGRPVQNTIQTNGVLLDEEWANFLRNNKFLVGLSLDGKKPVHDAYRLDAAGEGSWLRVQKAARLLMRKKVEVNALATVNAESVHRPEETYRFLKALGFTFMQFIPIVETDPEDPSRSTDWSVDPEDYGRFLCRIFDLWKKDIDMDQLKAKISVRYFDSLLHSYLGNMPPDCAMMPECGVYLVVEHNGDVFPCDFYVQPDLRIGNIHSGNLRLMLNSNPQTNFGRMKFDMVDECRTCPWLKHCHGGCLKDRYRDPRDNGRSHFCRSTKIFLEHADPTFRELAKLYNRYY
jgi:uncharacterized protein